MTPQEIQFALDLLHKAWPQSRECPICRSSDPKWKLTLLGEIKEYHGGADIGGAPIVPLVMVTCGLCTGTQLFNAIALGVVSPEGVVLGT